MTGVSFPREEGGLEDPEFLRENAFHFGEVERFTAEFACVEATSAGPAFTEGGSGGCKEWLER
jgi:hypothetical protein